MNDLYEAILSIQMKFLNKLSRFVFEFTAVLVFVLFLSACGNGDSEDKPTNIDSNVESDLDESSNEDENTVDDGATSDENLGDEEDSIEDDDEVLILDDSRGGDGPDEEEKLISSPAIVSITADDPNEGDAFFSSGDVIIIQFSEPTNTPLVSNKIEIDALLVFSHKLGGDYVGAWSHDQKTLTVTILDANGANPLLGIFEMSLLASGNLRNFEGTSIPSVSRSGGLLGDWGQLEGPGVIQLIANSADNLNSDFSNGDIITIVFNEPTNQPLGNSKNEIDRLYTFSQLLGRDYSGVWLNALTHVITIIDTEGSESPLVGVLTVSIKSSSGLQSVALNSFASIDPSPVLTGTWGLESPSSFTASALKDSNQLKWTIVPNASSYNIYWSTTPNVNTNDDVLLNVARPYVHSDLIEGEVYYYIITAVNELGESLPSIEVSPVVYNLPSFKIQQWENYKKLENGNSLINNEITSIIQDKKNNMWIGTANGVSRFDGDTWMNYTSVDGLSDNFIVSMIVDKLGNIWFATKNGVSKFDGIDWVSFYVDDGLVSNNINCIFEDSKGVMWFGTEEGVNKFDGLNWTLYTKSNGLDDSRVTAIFEDSSGAMLFGMRNDNGFSKLIGDTWSFISDHYYGYIISDIIEDSSGDLWFSSYNTVSKYDGLRWTVYNDRNGLLSRDVRALLEDQLGTMWFATSMGVNSFDGSFWNNFTKSNTNGYIMNNDIRDVFEDESGSLWFGTAEGLSKYDSTVIVKNNEYKIEWEDSNKQLDYRINFYFDNNKSDYDGSLIVSGIEESDIKNSYTWNTSTVPSGVYYIYLVYENGISDESLYFDVPIVIK